MSGTMLDGLIRAVDEVEASDAHAVVVIGQGRAFSAGLALPDLIDLERDAMRVFIDRFAVAMRRVLVCPLPTVAAVHGHSHGGAPEGRTTTGVPVYNVALPVLKREFPDRPPFRLLEIPVATEAAVTAGATR